MKMVKLIFKRLSYRNWDLLLLFHELMFSYWISLCRLCEFWYICQIPLGCDVDEFLSKAFMSVRKDK